MTYVGEKNEKNDPHGYGRYEWTDGSYYEGAQIVDLLCSVFQ